MKTRLWEPNWSAAVDVLTENNCLTHDECGELKTAYGFLRDCETVLRRQENTTVSTLPKEAPEELRLALRLGLESVDLFRRTLENARSTIHRIYQTKTERR